MLDAYLSEGAYKHLCNLGDEKASRCLDILQIAKAHAGAHVSMKPFYPKFPAQVMEASEVKLCLNTLLYYWSSGNYIPHTEGKERPDYNEVSSQTCIRSLTIDDLKEYFYKVLLFKTSITESLKA
jgi:hypothetical protein